MPNHLRDALIFKNQDYDARDKQGAINSGKFPNAINQYQEKKLFWKCKYGVSRE